MEHSLRILIESKVPFLSGLLEPYASVEYVDPDDITPGRVCEVDAMIIRTRTRCDAALLEDSRCRFIATATIGTDHIDMPWCAAHGITVCNAPGCNAPAVTQYVLASIAAIDPEKFENSTVGIVGVGHVGALLASQLMCNWTGVRVLQCDPPKFRAQGGNCGITMQQLAEEADIITFHTPLTMDGSDATWHLADREWLHSLRRKPVIINAARGPVVDNAALVEAIDQGLVSRAVIDCWEGEPHISRELLWRACVATPHIAGYSIEGKWRASQMALDALCSHFCLPHIALREPKPEPTPIAGLSTSRLLASYNPLKADTPALKSSPDAFEHLRNTYPLRHEPTADPFHDRCQYP